LHGSQSRAGLIDDGLAHPPPARRVQPYDTTLRDAPALAGARLETALQGKESGAARNEIRVALFSLVLPAKQLPASLAQTKDPAVRNRGLPPDDELRQRVEPWLADDGAL
jgi:hypothetical protein